MQAARGLSGKVKSSDGIYQLSVVRESPVPAILTKLLHIIQKICTVQWPCIQVLVQDTERQRSRIPHHKPSARNQRTLLVTATVLQWSLESWPTSSTAHTAELLLNTDYVLVTAEIYYSYNFSKTASKD